LIKCLNILRVKSKLDKNEIRTEGEIVQRNYSASYRKSWVTKLDAVISHRNIDWVKYLSRRFQKW